MIKDKDKDPKSSSKKFEEALALLEMLKKNPHSLKFGDFLDYFKEDAECLEEFKKHCQVSVGPDKKLFINPLCGLRWSGKKMKFGKDNKTKKQIYMGGTGLSIYITILLPKVLDPKNFKSNEGVRILKETRTYLNSQMNGALFSGELSRYTLRLHYVPVTADMLKTDQGQFTKFEALFYEFFDALGTFAKEQQLDQELFQRLLEMESLIKEKEVKLAKTFSEEAVKEAYLDQDWLLASIWRSCLDFVVDRSSKQQLSLVTRLNMFLRNKYLDPVAALYSLLDYVYAWYPIRGKQVEESLLNFGQKPLNKKFISTEESEEGSQPFPFRPPVPYNFHPELQVLSASMQPNPNYNVAEEEFIKAWPLFLSAEILSSLMEYKLGEILPNFGSLYPKKVNLTKNKGGIEVNQQFHLQKFLKDISECRSKLQSVILSQLKRGTNWPKLKVLSDELSTELYLANKPITSEHNVDMENELFEASIGYEKFGVEDNTEQENSIPLFENMAIFEQLEELIYNPGIFSFAQKAVFLFERDYQKNENAEIGACINCYVTAYKKFLGEGRV